MSQSDHAFLETAIRKTKNGVRMSGVRKSSNGKRWRARATYNKKEIYLGSFDSESDARLAVNAFWKSKEAECSI